MNSTLKVFQKSLGKFGLRVNSRKTKLMVVDKKKQPILANIMLNDSAIEQVTEFCYLGSVIYYDNRCISEIKKRIVLAKKAFQNKKNLLLNEHLNLK